MKRTLLLLALWLVTTALLLPVWAWYLVLCLAGHDRGARGTIALDQFMNALAGGSEDETISSRAAKARRQRRRWACVLCRWLDEIDPGHCERNVEVDRGEPTESPPG